jgi:penicillin amidase
METDPPTTSARRRRTGRLLTRGLPAAAALAILATGVAAWWIRSELHASLPQLDGRRLLAGLAAPVTIARDALGVASVRGASREDVARATGFVHAQDRFFQMDLNRRRAAGELSALVGGRALVLDVEVRRHRFRAVARSALQLMTIDDRRVLDAYAAGVNSGLQALAAPPFEYLLLRQQPAPWRVEDSLLVVLSMFITLQDVDGSYESALGTMRELLPPAVLDLLVPPGTEWDAPVRGDRFSVPPIPAPAIYNLRERRRGAPAIDLPERPDRLDAAAGSNNWAVSGRLTDGGALVANDMHLTVRVPNLWYRMSLEWSDAGPEPHRLIGVTLPGFPSLVTGSNTHVAWGFTNTYGDWSDLVLLDVNPANPRQYRTANGWRDFVTYDEEIEVAGGNPRRERVEWTIWGPVVDPDYRGRMRAYRWVAHSPERLATLATRLEVARSIDAAMSAANGLGAPGQNMVVADRSGRIAWTIYGSIPRRTGLDGRFPESWADGARGWDGWLTADEYPRIVDPPDGRIWTANARVVDGEMLSRIGDGSFEVGSRATIIRDRLMAKQRFTPRDMLDIQLDTSAAFLARWRDLILRSLSPRLLRGQPARARFRELVERQWDGHASPASVGYRLTRMFREQVSDRVMTFVLAECYAADASFNHRLLRRREGPVWKLLAERPLHFLDPQYASWDDLLAAAVDAVIETTGEGAMADASWADYNVSAYRHPLSGALPFIGRWLDMPLQPVPGDLFTPRVQWGALTASERMVVSPGREAEGFMHMPTGQSGHPLSPFYGNSHAAWLNGAPSPFLPGPAAHELVLTP